MNAIPRALVPKGTDVMPTDATLKSWRGDKTKPVGVAKVMMRNIYIEKKYNVKVVIVEENLTAMLGLRASEVMKFITVN